MMLVGHRGVLATHGHYCPFMLPEGSGDHSNMDVVQMYLSLKKQVSYIHLSPDFTFNAIGQNIVNLRQGVVIWNGININLSIIIDPAWQHHGVCLWNNE